MMNTNDSIQHLLLFFRQLPSMIKEKTASFFSRIKQKIRNNAILMSYFKKCVLQFSALKEKIKNNQVIMKWIRTVRECLTGIENMIHTRLTSRIVDDHTDLSSQKQTGKIEKQKGKFSEDDFLQILSQIMEDTSRKNVVMTQLGNIRALIERQLVPLIESLGFENKYRIIDQLKSTCADMFIYTLYPELIHQNIICFYQPDSFAVSSLNRNYFGHHSQLRISKYIPTFVGVGTKVSVVNLAHKRVSILHSAYEKLVRFSDRKRFDLAEILSCCFLPSEQLHSVGALLCIPEITDCHQKLYWSIIHTANILVIHAKKLNMDLIQNFCNLSFVIIYGSSSSDLQNIRIYCNQQRVGLIQLDSFMDAIRYLGRISPEKPKWKCSFLDQLDHQLSELMRCLALQKTAITGSFEEINDNLLYQDHSTADAIRMIKGKYMRNLDNIEKLYHELRTISDTILNEAFEMQRILQMNDLPIAEAALAEELFIQKATIYKAFPENNIKETVRKYHSIYAAILGCQFAADMVLKDYLGEAITDVERRSLLRIPYLIRRSDLMKHKIIDICQTTVQEINCRNAICELIKSLHSSLTPAEMRLMGHYYLSTQQTEPAKDFLMEALRDGDVAAGEIYRKAFVSDRNSEENRKLASLGVAQSALEIASGCQDWDSSSTIIHYNIAAASGMVEAAIECGDHFLEKSEELSEDSGDEISQNLKKKALHYYLFAEKNSEADSDLLDKIALIYYESEMFDMCLQYCKKTKSDNGLYLMGMIYAYGKGVSKDRETALSYFEQAAAKGMAEAQVEYERILAQINAEKQKSAASNSGSYSSYSYYSGYYSSYYSGSSYSSGW